MSAPASSATHASAPGRYRFVIYALVVMMNFTLGVTFLAPASLLPLITDEYDLTRAQGGFVVTSVTLVFTVASLPAAVLVARWNMRTAYAIGWLLMGCGVLTPFLTGFGALIGLRAVQGLGASALTPLTAAIIMRWAPQREVPIVNAVSLAALTVGLGGAQNAGPALANLFGWEWALALEGVIALVGAGFWFVLWRNRTAPVGADAGPVSAFAVLSVFRRRETWLLSLAVIGPWAQFITLSTWLPTYYTEVRGLSLGVAGFTAAVFAFAGIPANIIGGVIAVRTARRRPILIWSGALIGAAGVTAVFAPAGLLLYLAVIAAGFVQWVYEPTLFTIPIELPCTSPERAGAIWAAILTAGNAASFVAPIFVGFVADVTGNFIPGILVVTTLSFTIFIAGLLLPETGPVRRATVP